MPRVTTLQRFRYLTKARKPFTCILCGVPFEKGSYYFPNYHDICRNKNGPLCFMCYEYG